MTAKSIASLLVCLALGVGAATSAGAADKVTLMLDWTPGGVAAAWYYGIEQKCFADADIDLTVQRGYGGSDTVTKIAAGVAPFGVADLNSVIIGRLKAGTNVKGILPVYAASPMAVAYVAGAPIKTVSDFEGKTIAAAPGDSTVQVLPLAFQSAKADFAKVKVQSVEASTLTGLLLQGKVDGITTFVTSAILINKAAAQVGKTVEALPFGADLGIYSNSVFTSDKLLAENPGLVARFRKGAICAFDKTSANLVPAMEAMNRAVTGIDVPLHAEVATLAMKQLVYGAAAHKKAGFGWDLDTVARTVDIATKAQGLTSTLPASDFVAGD